MTDFENFLGSPKTLLTSFRQMSCVLIFIKDSRKNFFVYNRVSFAYLAFLFKELTSKSCSCLNGFPKIFIGKARIISRTYFCFLGACLSRTGKKVLKSELI